MEEIDRTSRAWPWSIALLVVIGSLCPGPPPALAQVKPEASITPSAAGDSGALSPEVIESRLKQVQAATDLDEAARTKALDLYRQAADQAALAQEYARRAGELATIRNETPERVAELKETVDQPAELAPLMIPQDASTVQLEQLSAQAAEELAAARKELALAEAEPKRRADRRVEIPKRLQEIRQQLAELDKSLAAAPPPNEPEVLTQAHRTLLAARQQALQQETAALEQELATYDATVELMTLRLRAASRNAFLAEAKAKRLSEIVEQRRGTEADEQLRRALAAAQRLQEAGAPRRLRELAEANVALAQRRVGADGLTERIRAATAEGEAVEKRLSALRSERQNIEQKLQIAGIKGAIGQLLVKDRHELPDVRVRRQNIRAREDRAGQVRLELLDVRQQYVGTQTVDQTRLEILAGMSAEEVERWEAELADLLDAQRGLRDSVVGDLTTLFNKLVDVSASEQELITEAETFRKLLDQHILWIRSTEPLYQLRLSDLKYALRWLLDGPRWGELGQVLLWSVLDQPGAWLLAVATLFVLGLSQNRLRSRLRELGQMASRPLQPFRVTTEAFLLTLLRSAPGPLAMLFVGWALSAAEVASAFARSVGGALLWTAAVFATLELLRNICRGGGLAEAHFRWRSDRLAVLRRHLRWFPPAVLPPTFLVGVFEQYSDEAAQASLGRAALMVVLLLLMLFLACVLRRAPASAETQAGHAAAQTTSRATALGYQAIVVSPLVLAGLAAAGYLYTAVELSWRLLATGWLVLGVTIGQALAVRWLYLARARFALEQVKPQLEAAQEPPAHPEAPGAEPTIEPPSPAVDLAKINVQTRRLLSLVVALTSVIGLWLIWADVLPALEVFNAKLWTTAAPELRVVTLADVLLAGALLVLVYVAGRNLPGLLEVALLKQLPLDSGARHAVTTLVRYFINGTGLLVACNMIGLYWSQVQWLVAAVGLGLGFGLQEIFANFVAGIILLFERPIRVGDIVSIGDETGVVTRIQIRATTLQNWDRKEFIVPNKDLITGRLLNWTLTDAVNRLVINVGVAYGSDTERVRALLQKVLADDPLVLDDPPPIVTLEGFGESALNFVLRGYLGGFENRLETIHRLHSSIHRVLREAGIEIAFPQRDLHIRSIDARWPFGPTSVPEAGRAAHTGRDASPASERAAE